MDYNVESQGNIKVTELGEKNLYNFVKRLMDFIGSFVGLIVLSPVFLLVAILIRLDSKGPIIFGHVRVGMNGEKFKAYKFRSMVPNAKEVFDNFTKEQKDEFEKNFKLDNDPRITKIGGFLRKTSLDELPQLFNIIKGEMSVVGPRPIIEKEIRKYGNDFKKAFSVKSGLTGYWQANGRSDTTYEERVKMDLYYIDNRSLVFDIKIILKTAMSVIKREGAK
ncbi:sugar transferase [Clostridium gasigenes]|uniref:Sugar transferase n=1 Tax=Clostridium gasigenes TaxID=94869 RepID=A0A7X0S9K2_9CLOT|nr:sugar transferase [Clostridium gasigenes]MBB6713515.1 sugar transferase [Clostridium gasigenes]